MLDSLVRVTDGAFAAIYSALKNQHTIAPQHSHAPQKRLAFRASPTRRWQNRHAAQLAPKICAETATGKKCTGKQLKKDPAATNKERKATHKGALNSPSPAAKKKENPC